jgi:hypothetical protein
MYLVVAVTVTKDKGVGTYSKPLTYVVCMHVLPLRIQQVFCCTVLYLYHINTGTPVL